MSKNYKRERAWIKKKLDSGVNRDELRECVGAFSNKKKKKVMAEKKLSSAGYDKRYKFLSNVYVILCDEPVKRQSAKMTVAKSRPSNSKTLKKKRGSAYDYFYDTEYTSQHQAYREESW